MPQSRKRRSQRDAHIDYIPHKKKRKSAVPVAIIVCGLLAFGIAWFANSTSTTGMIIGAVVGAIIGYFAGKQMDKAFDKK